MATTTELELEKPAGRTFDLPVDTENKATSIKLFSIARPHMRAFHLSWISFFTSFISTFAAAPLVPIIRDDLDMNKTDLANAGIAAVTGAIGCRVVMGVVCDMYGPRYGHAVLMLASAPAVFCMAIVTGPGGFIAVRCFIGMSLATFVATQFWSSVMFNVKIVGIANATTAGWGNLGGGITQLLMPVVYSGVAMHQDADFSAWRMCFFLPGLMHIFVGILVLMFSEDLPEGNYEQLKKTGNMEEDDPIKVFVTGCMNYRMWVLVATYGMCFGIELTMNNIAAPYLFDQFDLDLVTAGLLASLYGLMNIFARSFGGIMSDMMCKKWGMRGRLWCLWSLQTMEGILCIIMGLLYNTLAGTICAMVAFSIFVQGSEGASYGIVPFVTRRALGVASGFIGAGGNAGSSIATTLFFKSDKYETYEGIQLMGLMVILVTLLVPLIHFPMWGSMFFAGNPDFQEEDYYMADYSEEEKAAGKANGARTFAQNCRSQRGDEGQAQWDAKFGEKAKSAAV